jgi:hypothetical protein
VYRAWRTVTVTLDGWSVAELTTDERGAFSTPYTIEVVSSGNHTLGAEVEGFMAAPRTLSVEPVDSALNMTIEVMKNGSEIVCRGYLVANRPVRYAPVDILWEDHEPLTATTDAKGFYRTVIRLPAGTHRLRAWFENSSYPVSTSMSAIYSVTSTGEAIPSVRKEEEARWANGTFRYEPEVSFWDRVTGTALQTVPVAFVALMGAVAALGYLRRGVREEVPPPPLPEGTPAPSLDLFREVPFPVPPETLAALYLRSLRELGLSGAAHLVYRRLASIVGTHAGIGNPALLTSREMAGACARRPYGKVFGAFVRCYEGIRYAGQRGEGTRRNFEDSMERTRTAVEGEGR